MKKKADVEDEIEAKRRRLASACLRLEQTAESHMCSEDEKLKLQKFGNELSALMKKMPDDEIARELSNMTFFKKRNMKFPLELPFSTDLKRVKSSRDFCFHHPEQIYFLRDWLPTSPATLDLNVIIPQECFGSRDYLNFAYFVKRAHYISRLAGALEDHGVDVSFATENFDHLEPILICEKEGVGKIRVFCSPPEDFVKPSRLRPENNNLRPMFCRLPGNLGDDVPTPRYNSKIANDMLRQKLDSTLSAFYSKNHTLTKALVLAHLWLRFCGFNKKKDGFSVTLLAAWLKLICEEGNIGEHSSVIDILSAFFASLVTVDWKAKPSSLSTTIDENVQSQFLKYYDYTFTDETGYWNLAASLSSTTMEEMKVEASKVVKHMDSFKEVTKSPRNILMKFDFNIRLELTHTFLLKLLESSPWECLDSCGDYVSVFLKKAAPILTEAWKGRVSSFYFLPLKADPNIYSTMKCDKGIIVLIGLHFAEGWNNPVTRGPPALSPEAKSFTTFWGEICELRKYPDNAICESVVWSNGNSPFCAPFLICQHILNKHLSLGPSFVKPCMTELMEKPMVKNRYDAIWLAYEKLTNYLRYLEGLPLSVASISPVSPFLRRTEPFPPRCAESIDDESSKKFGLITVPANFSSPPYLPTVEVHLTMEYSGKWGQSLDAINHLKTAFYIKLAELLVQKHAVRSFPYKEYLIVKLDDTLFRLLIVHPKEAHLMKKKIGGGSLLKDTPESKERQLEIELKPQLVSYLHSMSQKYAAFAETCRHVAYWLSSHRCSDLIDPLILETLVASVFIKPLSLHPPKTATSGLLQTLNLLATHDWYEEPLLVDFNNEWTEKDVDEIHGNFVKLRITLPCMVVCTPVDRLGNSLTRKQPEPTMHKYICDLAAGCINNSYKIVRKGTYDLRCLFMSKLSYDVRILIHQRHLVRKNRGNKVLSKTERRDALSVFDYDPVEQYVACLRRNFGSLAIFMYNKYDGSAIDVQWRPEVAVPKQANVSSCLYRHKSAENELTVNMGAVLEDFLLLGYGLVQRFIFSDPNGALKSNPCTQADVSE